MPELSVIIINWNSVNYLEKCLSSIYKNIAVDDIEIIVVDNGSYDGSDRLIIRDFPDIKFIQLDNNIGFAKANNLAFSYATSEFILFINPDTELLDSSIDKMLEFLKSSYDAGAVGCRLLNSDFSLQISCVQAFPNLFNQILDTEFLIRLRLKRWGIENAMNNKKFPIKVDVISGACVMVKRKVFEKAGLFTSDYYMYGEDVDLCHKIKQVGYNSYYIDDAKVIHHGGKSSESQDDRFFEVLKIMESRILFFNKTKGFAYARCYQFMHIIISMVRIMIIFMISPFFKLFTSNKSLKFSLMKWIDVLVWSLNLRHTNADRLKESI